MAVTVTRLTHKIAKQLRLVAESCTICSSRCRRPVRKLMDTSSYNLCSWNCVVILPQNHERSKIQRIEDKKGKENYIIWGTASWEADSHSPSQELPPPPPIEPKGSLSCSQQPTIGHQLRGSVQKFVISCFFTLIWITKWSVPSASLRNSEFRTVTSVTENANLLRIPKPRAQHYVFKSTMLNATGAITTFTLWHVWLYLLIHFTNSLFPVPTPTQGV
jgi:hypothetical protein